MKSKNIIKMDERTDSIATGSLYSIGPFDLIVLFSFGGLLLWWFLKKNKEPTPVLNGLAGLKPISSTNNVAASDSNNFLEKIKISDDTKEPPDTSSDMELHVSDDTKEPPDTSSAMELYVDGDTKEPPDTSSVTELHVSEKQMPKNDLIVDNNFSNSRMENVKVINDYSVQNHYYSSTEKRSASSESSLDPSCDVFDMMCYRINDWRKLVKALKIENQNFISDFKENENYNEKHEKIKICIVAAKRQSKGDLDWCYWRKILLAIDENDLLEDIEEKYPNLPQENANEITKVDHQLFHDICNIGIFAHHAKRPENFKYLPDKLKDSIDICIGGKLNMSVGVEKFCNFQTDYFTNYSIFQNIRKYDFSNINKTEECQILKTQHAWLEKYNDDGFTVKGYDSKDHLADFSNYVNVNPRADLQDVILTYSVKHDIILHINIAKEYGTKSTRDNCLNIRHLRTANKVCLDGHPFIFLPVILVDKNRNEINDSRKCETCFDSGLIVSSDAFKDIQLLDLWWKKILKDLNVMKQLLVKKPDISNKFLRNIIGFKALATFNLPTYTHKNIPEHTIKEAQKIIMLTPEQQNIIYSKTKYKIIKGSFGSGKTIIAQEMIKLVAREIGDNEMIFYLLHDSNSIYVQEMRKLVGTFENKNIIASRMNDFVKNNKLLSSILKYLLKMYPGRTMHLFIEEFNGEDLNEKEVEKIKLLLKNEEFKNSHIVLVTQSMESERFEVHDEGTTPFEKKYKYEVLERDAGFQIFELSYLLRCCFEINNIIDTAIPILRDAVTKSIVPNHESSQHIKENENIKASATTKFQADSNSSVNGLKSFEVIAKSDNIKSSAATKVHADSSSSVVREKSRKTTLRTEDNSINNSVMDMDNVLKHYSTNATKYRNQTNIESRYTYVGKREKAHNVKGSMPSVYYPFNKDVKSYIHQVFSISEVLKDIISEKNGKQVIICLNKDSLNILKDVLNTNKINWVADPERFYTENFDILLTEYIYIRGCEYFDVILIYPTNEKHLKHNMVDCLSRCKLHLRVIVLHKIDPDKTLLQILEEWKNNGLIQIYDGNYLNNADKLELQKYKHLLEKVEQPQTYNMDDPIILQSLQSLQRTKIGSSYSRLRFVFDKMCCTISDWRRFANALGLGGNLIKDLEENMKYDDIHEKLNKCIVEKTETSVDAAPDWFYWRNILLYIDEGLLVDDIEVKYPWLLQDDRFDLISTVHKAFDDFGIIAHDASRKELFEKLATKLKDRVEICIGDGAKKMVAVRKMQEMSNIYEGYFQKYNILEKTKIYDFSRKNQECNILKTIYTWLQKNNDAGFVIKGYDVKQHVEMFFESYYYETTYNDSYILTYSEKNNVIFYVDTDPTDVKKSMRDNRLNIRHLRTSNKCLDGKSFIYLPITLTDPNTIKEVRCKTCIDLQLVVTAEIFSDPKLFDKWWEQISTEVKDIADELKQKQDISNDLLKSIVGFMAFVPFDLPKVGLNYPNYMPTV